MPADIVRCTDYAASLDTGGPYTGDGIGKLRFIESKLTEVVSVEKPTPGGLWHDLLISDAVGHGRDSFPPALSAGQAIGLEWITGERGRGKNGRTFFPYFAAASYDGTSVDKINTAASDFVLTTCSAFAFSAPAATGGELVVFRRRLGGAPADPLTSNAIVDVRIRAEVFTHQRRRVELDVPIGDTP